MSTMAEKTSPMMHQDTLTAMEFESMQENSLDETAQEKTLSLKYQLYATIAIALSAVVGFGIGIALSNNNVEEDVVNWIALPGDLFIRALKCIIIPMIFVNVILAVIQMLDAGNAGKIGKYTIGMYLLTTFIAAMEGLTVVLLFKDSFKTSYTKEEPSTFINIMCPNENTFLSELVDTGNVICRPYNETLGSSFEFVIDDINDVYVSNSGQTLELISFSENLQRGIFMKAVPSNIVSEMANGNFVGIITFAIVFGVAAQRSHPRTLLLFLNEMNNILVKLIEWIILFTPIAAASLIAGAIGGRTDLEDIFLDVGTLIGANLIAMFAHVFLIYPILFFVITKTNPYAYLRYIIPAQIFAFACASSAATLPVTSKCVQSSGKVPDSIRNFVLPIGATINMDGTAIGHSISHVFLATTGGFEDQLEFTTYFMILIVASIGSMGAAPVPNAGLVLIIVAFNTVFGTTGEPANFFIIIATDWLLDRFQTSINVTGDSMIARIVTYLSGEEIRSN